MVHADTPEIRLPIVEEQVSVEKREVATDRVRIRTTVEVREALIEDKVRIGTLDVVRTSADREVTEAPTPYHEGDTLVIPIVEERLVVEKRLFVVEELRVTGSFREEAVSIPVELRRTRAIVERAEQDQNLTGSN